MAIPRENCDGAAGCVQCSEGPGGCYQPHIPVRERPRYEIIPLIEGYSENDGPGAQKATGSSTLIKGPKNVIVDTGNPSEKDKLTRALQAAGVTPDEIHFVVCTHGHSDHVGNLNVFPDATFIVSYDISKKDRYIVHNFKDGIPYKIDDGLDVIPTPGHTNHDVSVVVEDTKFGVVAITGDLFEKAEDLVMDQLWTQYSENRQQQYQNRQKVLRKADYIVPGHGKMFKNTTK